MADSGAFFPQGRVRAGDEAGRFDDIVGAGWCIVAADAGVLAGLTDAQRDAWAGIGGRIAVVGTPQAPLVDVDGTYAAWFAGHPCRAAVVRPDWYLYGMAADGTALASLLDRLQAGLHGGAAARVMEPALGVDA